MQATIVEIGGGQQHPRTHQPRCSRGAVVPRMSVRPVAMTSAARELAGAERCGLGGEPFSLISSHVDEPGGQRIGHRGDDHEVRSRRSRSSANRRGS